MHQLTRVFIGLVRLGLGWIFLWAFVDKLFGLGFATPAGQSWLNGVSPTKGYLTFATKGPFAAFFQSLAGNPAVDILFMVGLVCIGSALVLGIMVRIACYAGALLLVLMFISGSLPPAHNPLLDEHIIYALTLLALSTLPSGEWLGFGGHWKKWPLVKRYVALQ